MKYNQIASALNGTISAVLPQGNGITGEETGQVTVVAEDLSNIVEVGKLVLDYTSTAKGNFNSFVEGLIDRVGKVQMVDRTYTSSAPSIMKESWEYASIKMKVRVDVSNPIETTSYKLGALAANVDSNGYNGIGQNPELDPFILNPPTAQAKFYNAKDTYTVPITIAERQLKTAFTSAAEMSRFIAMIENRIATMKVCYTDALIRRTINNLIANVSLAGTNVVNLLSLYNTGSGKNLTAAQALTDKEFLRYAAQTIKLYTEYVKDLSKKYNDGTYLTFTPEDRLHLVALTQFDSALSTYLYADTYHDTFVKLDGYETVRYWQGQGTNDNDLSERSKIIVTPSTMEGVTAKQVTQQYILAVMFDSEAAAVCNEDDRVTSQWNPRGEYFNYFYMWDAEYLNDTAENCIVFTLADPTTSNE